MEFLKRNRAVVNDATRRTECQPSARHVLRSLTPVRGRISATTPRGSLFSRRQCGAGLRGHLEDRERLSATTRRVPDVASRSLLAEHKLLYRVFI
jgi:hypothetical protein